MDIVISRGFLHHEKGEENEENENKRPGKLDIIIHSYLTYITTHQGIRKRLSPLPLSFPLTPTQSLT